MLGKYGEHTDRAGKIYILKLTPQSPAMDLHLASIAETGQPEIDENDVLLKVDGKSVDGLELDTVFDAMRGPEGTEVVLDLSRKNKEGAMVASHVTLVRRRVGGKPLVLQ